MFVVKWQHGRFWSGFSSYQAPASLLVKLPAQGWAVLANGRLPQRDHEDSLRCSSPRTSPAGPGGRLHHHLTMVTLTEVGIVFVLGTGRQGSTGLTKPQMLDVFF